MLLDRSCGSHGIRGVCPDGHEYVKEAVCGRDWCPICGKEDSKAHQRRKASWVPRVTRAASWLYLVFTIPPEEREHYRSKEALGKLGVAAKRMLQRRGFACGLRRWHWFGDRSRVYHPHLNVLVPGEWLTRLEFTALRVDLVASWARILHCDPARINFKLRICDTPRKILHRVKYITRATFLHWQWDESLARELVGFRNSAAWGSWAGPAAWEPERIEEESGYAVRMLERGLCPECAKPIAWGGSVRAFSLGRRHVGGGYWGRPGKVGGRL